MGPCIAAATSAAAVSACTDSAMVILIVSDAAATLSVLRDEGLGKTLQGRTLINLTSGNPDEGRAIAEVVAEVVSRKAVFIDGAYCENPTKARAGAGQLFLSSEQPDAVEGVRRLLERIGSVAFCGGIGASRALDYAVVDLFFANF